MVVDLFLVYSFIKRLVKPFDEWEAYKLGIIDDEGNILIPRKKFTKKAQRDAFGVFDKLILNIKKLLAKLPGGQTRLGSYAAALWLIKEQANMEQAGMLNESVELEDSDIEFMLEGFVEEYAEIFKDENVLDEMSMLTKLKAKIERGKRGPSKKATPVWARQTGAAARKNRERAAASRMYQMGKAHNMAAKAARSRKEDVEEDAPTVNVGGGAIAGLGVGPQGEPGLTKAQQKKYKKKNFKDLKKSLKDDNN